MAPDVRRTFASICQEQQGTSAEEAEQWLNDLSARDRYRVDVWGSYIFQEE